MNDTTPESTDDIGRFFGAAAFGRMAESDAAMVEACARLVAGGMARYHRFLMTDDPRGAPQPGYGATLAEYHVSDIAESIRQRAIALYRDGFVGDTIPNEARTLGDISRPLIAGAVEGFRYKLATDTTGRDPVAILYEVRGDVDRLIGHIEADANKALDDAAPAIIRAYEASVSGDTEKQGIDR